ncbi:hypothetical protein ACHAWF_006429 [Thalassiosira exigua]
MKSAKTAPAFDCYYDDADDAAHHYDFNLSRSGSASEAMAPAAVASASSSSKPMAPPLLEVRSAPLLVDSGSISISTPAASNSATALLTPTSAAIFALAALATALLRRRSRPKNASSSSAASTSSTRPRLLFPARTGLPPCRVPSHPLFGHMPRMYSPPDSPSFRELFVDHADDAGLSTFWFLHVKCVSVLKAEHARVVFRNSVERSSVRIITRHFTRSLGQDSLILLDGGASDREKWRHHRNLMKVAFTTHAVEAMADKVWKVANGFASSLSRECAKDQSPDGQSRGCYRAEATHVFKWVTLDIFGKVAFDHVFGCSEALESDPLATSLNHLIEDSNARCKPGALLNPFHQCYWLPTRRNREFRRHGARVRGLFGSICRERMRDIRRRAEEAGAPGGQGSAAALRPSKGDDLLTALLKSEAQSRDVSPEDSHEDLVKMLLTLFFAGYDTSSVLLSMITYVAASDPVLQRTCAREARDASETLDDDASAWESNLAYCRAVVLETLRVHPPVYTNARNLNDDVVLDGRIIPKRTRVVVPIVQVHTDPRNFARPKEFLPERWVRKDPATGRWTPRDHGKEPTTMPGDPTYLPPANPRYLFTFGDGARNCIGHRLALQESTIVFACLVRDLTVELPEGFVLRKRKKFALAPPTEMPLTFRKREW